MAGVWQDTIGKSENFQAMMADMTPPDHTPACGPVSHNALPGIDIHCLRPEEADGVALLMHEVYRDTYPKKYVYDPEQIRKKNAMGEIVPVVATSSEGRVLGYGAMNPVNAYPETGLLGSLAVLPVFRSHGLGGLILRHLLSCSEGRGFQSLTGGAFTVHPYSQMALQRLGFHTSAILLGSQPQEISFQGISGKLGQRESMAFLTKVISHEEYGLQYLPSNHHRIIQEITTELGLRIIPGSGERFGHESTVTEHSINKETGAGIVLIQRVGPDHRVILAGIVRQLRTKGAKSIRLHLSLSDQGSPALASAAEEMGFIFSGILPTKDGIILLLQNLHGVPIDYEQIHMGNPFGERLLSYIRSQNPIEETDSRQMIQNN
ncbi:MAG: GNAT family N-acetyltransferase [Methanoregula sp.]|nr:GNAT family N-acetyltransferase [Methanoregula sp.]